jgi:hypothetical protein
MGFRTIAYSATQGGAVTSLTAVTALADDSMTKIDSTHYKVPSQNLLIGLYAHGSALTRYQIKTPSLAGNQRVPVEVDEVDQTAATTATTAFPPFQDYEADPVPLIAGEGIEADIICSGAAQTTVVVWLGDSSVSYVTGPVLPGVRATSAQTLVANTWTNCTLTFDNQLPAGAYAVVGMEAFSATGQAARLAFPELGPRPGVIAGTQPSVRGQFFRTGNFRSESKTGNVSWGSFVQDSPPSVDFLAGAADTSETVIFDLVKIA